MNILGINAYHGDSAACLVIEGKVVNAIEEERIRRIKHWAGLPVESIKWCLEDANTKIEDIDYIAISRNPSAHLHKKILRIFTKSPSLNFLRNRISNIAKIKNIKLQIASALDVSISLIKAKIENVEHHRAHMASAFFVSPFKEAACVTVDGFGDFVSTMRAIGTGNKINVFDWVEYPHSLGIFYSALTQFLGFWNYGDEYKVMGLSAYGKPIYLNELKKIVKLKNNGLFELDTSYFLHDKEGVEMTWDNGSPTFGTLFSNKLLELLGKPREKEEIITKHYQDLASSVQGMYEETFFHILNDTYKKTKLDCIALAGGCIQNSLANGKIFEKTPFREIYIPSASYDAGTAIGAAMVLWNKKGKQKRNFTMEHSHLGPNFDNEFIKLEISKCQIELGKYDCKIEFIEKEDILTKKTVELIANGKIIGWFQGRTEFGPRALGNRSIVVDPRRSDMKDILNARVKKRESFRPFAPSILEEKVAEWFECNYPVPFMEKVYKIKQDKQKLIPIVCHNDGTGRLQTVSQKSNIRYYNLIKEFEKVTGVPIVLNTSFNDNEPIVNTPSEALRCFLNTKMDILVLENYMIMKP